jgi:hypothetical protein
VFGDSTVVAIDKQTDVISRELMIGNDINLQILNELKALNASGGGDVVAVNGRYLKTGSVIEL